MAPFPQLARAVSSRGALNRPRQTTPTTEPPAPRPDWLRHPAAPGIRAQTLIRLFPQDLSRLIAPHEALFAAKRERLSQRMDLLVQVAIGHRHRARKHLASRGEAPQKPVGKAVEHFRCVANLTLQFRIGNVRDNRDVCVGEHTGKVGCDVSLEQAYAFARSTGIALLSVIHHELGSLDRVSRIVKVLGLVNAVPDFADHPKVINGCSDLFIEVLGESGRHARTAIGAGSTPD